MGKVSRRPSSHSSAPTPHSHKPSARDFLAKVGNKYFPNFDLIYINYDLLSKRSHQILFWFISGNWWKFQTETQGCHCTYSSVRASNLAREIISFLLISVNKFLIWYWNYFDIKTICTFMRNGRLWVENKNSPENIKILPPANRWDVIPRL